MATLNTCINLYFYILVKIMQISTTTLDKMSQGLTDLTAVVIPQNTTIADFVNNSVTIVPVGYFQNLPHLDRIRLRQNNISIIEDYSFKGVPSLTILTLQFNQIQVIKTHTFSGLINLKKLRLYSNEIHTIQENSFQNLTSLKLLNLHANKLKTLEQSVFDVTYHPSALDSLNLKENPLKCDCLLSWLLVTDWLTVNHPSETFCARPPNLIGRNWDVFSTEDPICNGKHSVCFEVLELHVSNIPIHFWRLPDRTHNAMVVQWMFGVSCVMFYGCAKSLTKIEAVEVIHLLQSDGLRDAITI